MQIFLEELEHQRAALDALLNAAPERAAEDKDSSIYANPLLHHAGEERQFIDIKMETGTGKTYVYTRAMFALQQQLGLFKFIIVVPSLAIKAGTKSFIDSDYARQHFSQIFPNKRIALYQLNAGDFNGKKGRKAIPASLMQFHDAARNDVNTIHCLLLSDKGFLDREDSALFKTDYEQNFFGGANCPAEALRETRSIVMIDEPHRIKRSGKTYQNIIKRFAPQLIIRFGATFPEIVIAKGGKGKSKQIDYYRGAPAYDLDGVKAFNQDLVKGIEVQFPDLPKAGRTVFRVKKVSNKELVLQAEENKPLSFKPGDALSAAGFEGGISYEGGKKLSNDLELHEGMALESGVFANSYQEQLLSLALTAHFKTEAENFLRHENGAGFKVKTNALFFIDSISSYREPGGWLKQIFERLLRERLEAQLRRYPQGEYAEFLRASLKDVRQTHGGYFAKDWGEKDESAIAEEVRDILHKERTLPFKKADGSWNLRRFFFSKWTLREGWDNPNVFTICKLRSSGSETSKMQEAGRGLRLPVDEKGNRLSGGDWRLNFIIGRNEEDFAKKLVGKINADASAPLNSERLTAEMQAALGAISGLDEEALLKQLDERGIIKRNNDFKPGGYEELLRLYPELLTQNSLKRGKVRQKGEKPPMVRLRRENWEKIRSLWEALSKRYMVVFERLPAGELERLFAEALESEGAFDDNQRLAVAVERLSKGEGEVSFTKSKDSMANALELGRLAYAEFVKTIARHTALPVQIIHRALWQKLQAESRKGLDKAAISAKLNEKSCANIIALWHEKFAASFSAKYDYQPLDFKAGLSVFKDGKFAEEIAAGDLGGAEARDIADDRRNLYDPPFYFDSEIEHEIETLVVPVSVSVFGKIPRRAIKVPLYTGGSTTPDFVYVTEQGGAVALAGFVEAKSDDRRGRENRAVAAQETFFKRLPLRSQAKWKMVTKAAEAARFLAALAKEPGA